MIATSQFTISVIKDGKDGAPGATGPQGVSVEKVVREYRLSDSSTEMTGSGDEYTWSETKPKIPSGKYLWERERTDLSNNTSEHGTAHCDIVTSGLVLDVDRNTNAITSKVWESDITTKINEYDGSTGKSIRDRVTKTETDISGINTTISDIQTDVAGKADGSTVTTLTTKVNTISDTVDGHTQTIESNTSRIDDAEDEIESTKTIASQTADKFTWLVKSGTSASNFTLTSRVAELISPQVVIKDPAGSATIISGGKIHANAITTAMLATDAIKSTNYQASTSASSPYSATGTFLDLGTGTLYMPNFGVNGTTGAAYFNGTVNANAGKFGDDSSYWNIETVYDYNMQPHAALVGTGSPYLQTGNWQVSDNAVATRKYTSTSDSSGNATYYKDSGTNTFYDVGMKIPSNFSAYSASDSSVTKYNKAFYYGRKYTGNNAPSLDSDWTYFFSIDSGGNVITAGDVYEGGVKLSDKYAAITDVGSAYLPKTGGTITGNLSVNGSFTTNLMLQTNLGSTSSAQLTGAANAVVKPGVTGTLGVGNGGTGKNSWTANRLIYSSATNALSELGAGSSGQILKSNGSSAPSWVNQSTLSVGSATKATQDGNGNVIVNTYMPIAGGQFTGAVYVPDEFSADSAQLGSLIVNGVARFTNDVFADTFTGNLVGTASNAVKVGNNLVIKLNGGSTEGTNLFTYNGSAAKTINITASSIGAQASGTYAGGISNGGAASKLAYQSGNEINFVSTADTPTNAVYFNWKNGRTDAKTGTSSNIGYYFENYNGEYNHTTLYAAQFSGNAATATTATTADKVGNNLVILFNSGSTEGTNKFTYNGSAAKNVNITKAGIGLGNVENTALSTWTGSANLTTTKVGTLAAAATKSVDSLISASSTSTNLPTSAAVATFVEGKGYVTSSGVTSITLKAGTGISLDTDNTAITSIGTRTISLANTYGDTKNPYGTKTKNYVLAGPTTGSAAAPSFRALVADDIPTLTPAKAGLGNVTNNKQVNGLASGTTSGHLVSWGGDGYTVADSGIAVSSVNKTVKSLASNNDGKIVLTYLDGTTSDPIEVKIIGSSGSSVSYADALNVNGTAVGGAEQPVFINNQGKPQTANKIPKLNNTTTGGAFYAPTSTGTANQVLVSSGTGAPTWTNQSSLSVGSATNATNATTASKADKLTTGRTISLTGDVTGSTTFDGSGNVSITATVADDSHYHTVTNITTGNSSAQASLDPITATMIGSAASNKTFGLPANAITIQYSTNGGSTWTDYGASDAQKKALFAETRGFGAILGKSSSASTNTVNNQLRVIIEPTDRYVSLHGIYVWMSSNGNTCVMDLERSTIGAKDTFTSVFTNQPVSGWSGNNIRYFSGGTFGGGASQTSNFYKYRITFKQTAVNTSYNSAQIIDIRFIGTNVWSSPNTMVSKNHMYSWDESLNVTFPANITANTFVGALSGNAATATKLSASKTINGTSFDGSENITTANWGTSRDITIGNTQKTVNGSANYTWTPTEINRVTIGYHQDYQRVVIALCELSAQNTGIYSDWHGKIYRVRDNGLVPDYYCDIDANASYGITYGFYYNFISNFENNSLNALSGEGYRACVFKYNNKYYGGLEFYQVQAAIFYMNGVGKFTPFIVCYYNQNTSAVLNTEINNSITYSTSQCVRDHSYGIFGGSFTGNLTGNASTATKWASAQTVYVALGTASKTTSIQGGSSSAVTLGVDGVLGVANGGTGAASFTANSVIMSGSTTTGAFTTRAVTNNTSASAVTANTNLITANTLAYWTGSSNLTTCKQGTFGAAATYSATTSVTSGSSALVTSGGVSSALGNYVTLSTAQTISGAKTFSAVTSITNTTASTSKSTGALKVSGGVGISGQMSANTVMIGDAVSLVYDSSISALCFQFD